MQAPFLWNGNTGQQITPGQAKVLREMALARSNKPVATNFGEGLAAIGDALVSVTANNRASAAESEGQATVAQALAEARASGGSDGYYDVLSNPWATEGQRLVAGGLLDRSYQLGDRDAAWARDDAVRQSQWAREDSLLAAQPPSAPEIEEAYDSVTGQPIKQQWVGGEWQDFGGAAAPKEPLVTVNNGDNSSKFVNKADELAAARMDEIVSAGAGAQTFLGDIQMLTEIGKTLNTGKGTEVMAALGPFAEMAGIKVDGLSEAQAYDAIVSRMAPAMRIPGSGASSDFDAKQFLKSLPSLGNTPEGNAIVMETFSAIQQSKQAAAEIASQALSGQITWQEADAQIRSLGSPFEAFNKYRSIGGAGEADQAFTVNSDAEYDALPKGAIFIGPDGKKRRKP